MFVCFFILSVSKKTARICWEQYQDFPTPLFPRRLLFELIYTNFNNCYVVCIVRIFVYCVTWKKCVFVCFSLFASPSSIFFFFFWTFRSWIRFMSIFFNYYFRSFFFLFFFWFVVVVRFLVSFFVVVPLLRQGERGLVLTPNSLAWRTLLKIFHDHAWENSLCVGAYTECILWSSYALVCPSIFFPHLLNVVYPRLLLFSPRKSEGMAMSIVLANLALGEGSTIYCGGKEAFPVIVRKEWREREEKTGGSAQEVSYSPSSLSLPLLR